MVIRIQFETVPLVFTSVDLRTPRWGVWSGNYIVDAVTAKTCV